MRLDLFLAGNSGLRSRKAAQDLIADGAVLVNGKECRKASKDIQPSDEVTVCKGLKYVSRGGLKLERALELFAVDVRNKVCLDIGASTGGFTDCLLQNGAKSVVSVDVGHGQLDDSLRNDSRVESLEGTNILDFASKEDRVFSVIVSDVSFTSLKNIFPAIKKLSCGNTDILCLFKPQFEIGKSESRRLRDRKYHVSLLNGFISFIRSEGLTVLSIAPSPVRGGDGNIEYLFWITDSPERNCRVYDIRCVVNDAFNG